MCVVVALSALESESHPSAVSQYDVPSQFASFDQHSDSVKQTGVTLSFLFPSATRVVLAFSFELRFLISGENGVDRSPFRLVNLLHLHFLICRQIQEVLMPTGMSGLSLRSGRSRLSKYRDSRDDR